MATLFQTWQVRLRPYRERLGLIALGLYLAFGLLDRSFIHLPTVLHKLVILAVLGLLVVKEIFTSQRDRRAYLSLAVTVVLYLLIARVNGRLSYFSVSLLMVYGLRDIAFERLAKLAFWVSSLILAGLVVFSQLGLVRDFVEAGARQRHYLGFLYALFPSTVLLHLLMLFLFLKGRKAHYYQLVLWFLATVWIYWQTDSRLTFAMSLLVLAVNSLIKWRPRLVLHFLAHLKAVIYYPAIAFAFSLFTAAIYQPQNPLFAWINRQLGGRLELAQRSLNLHGMHILPRQLRWIGNGLRPGGKGPVEGTYLYVDNAYLQTFQHYGVLIYIGVLLALSGLLAILQREREYLLMLILILLGMNGFIDDLVLNLFFNVFWLLGGRLMNKHYQYRQTHPQEAH